MANLIIEDNNLSHLIKRLNTRFGHDEQKAKNIIENVKTVIKKEVPEDWRFTVSPSAKFIIAYEPESYDFRFLGRSYRDFNQTGIEIIKKLKSNSLSSQDLKNLIDDYKKLLFNPNCQIFHELKTVYTSRQDLSDEKRLFEKITSSLPHIIPLDAKRIALRPNAIIIGNEIWVRQGEYFDLSKETKDDYEEYLIFVRLTGKGPDKSKVHIYTLNKQGHLKFFQKVEGEIGSFPVFSNKDKNKRSQSYWTLPTYVDAVYLDLDYSRKEWQGDENEQTALTAEDMLVLTRIEKLLEMVRIHLGLAPMKKECQ